MIDTIAKIILKNYLPAVKKRPRFAGGRVYSPSASGEESLAWMIREQTGHLSTITEPVSVRVEMHSLKKLPGDADNYLKFVLDALQKSGLVKNDRHVRAASIRLYDRVEDDFTMIFIGALPASPEKCTGRKNTAAYQDGIAEYLR